MSDKINGFSDWLEDKRIRALIFAGAILSFILANAVIYWVFYKFATLHTQKDLLSGHIVIFCVGLYASFLLLKTQFFITSKYKKKEKTSSENPTYVDIGKWNLFLISFRLVFFNILNDLFMVLVVWSAWFAIMTYFGLISFTTESFSTLVSTLTVIGILAGIFQFFIQTYKDNMNQKVIGSISKHMIEILKQISNYDEFLQFIKKRDRQLYDDVMKEIGNPKVSFMNIVNQFRKSKDVTNMFINLTASNDSKAIAADTAEGIDKKKLRKQYKDFIQSKHDGIREEIDKIDLTELRKNLLPNILFFDELLTDLTKSGIELEPADKVETFQEHITESVQEHILYLIERILDVNEKHKSKTNDKPKTNGTA